MNSILEGWHACNCALPALTGSTECCKHCLNNPNREEDIFNKDFIKTPHIDAPQKEWDDFWKKWYEQRPYITTNTSTQIEIIPQMYNMIANEDELKWFFEHVVMKPQVNESYSAVFVSRHKKLTKEEQKTLGLTRKESEFLATVTFKNNYRSEDKKEEWTFARFLKTLKKFNVDKGAYTTSLGEPLPEKTLAVIFYVNPCDDVLVADELSLQIQNTKTALTKALLHDTDYENYKETYRLFCNLESNLKHLKAHCKGTTYWMDFDIDVPQWFKEHKMKGYGKKTYYEFMKEDVFTPQFGKGNFVIVDTSGGYHVLVRTSAIKRNPNEICGWVKDIYDTGVIDYGEEPYLDENGNCKFECIITASHQKFNPEEDKEAKEAVKKLEDLVAKKEITQQEFKVMRRGLYDSLKNKKENNKSSIPGIPLPGTFQYGRPVIVLNKEDFE